MISPIRICLGSVVYWDVENKFIVIQSCYFHGTRESVYVLFVLGCQSYMFKSVNDFNFLVLLLMCGSSKLQTKNLSVTKIWKCLFTILTFDLKR